MTTLECTVNTSNLNLQNLTTLTRLTSLQLKGGGVRIKIADNIGQLQPLTQLQTLHLERFDGLPASIASLSALKSLDLVNGTGNSYDLNGLKQLKHLYIEWDRAAQVASRRLILPTGGHVSLCTMMLAAPAIESACIDFMSGLEAASELRQLVLFQVHPHLSIQAQWPQNMPRLDTIKLIGSSCALPSEWVQYSALQELNLSRMAHAACPDWFSGLTMLTKLSLQKAALTEFPICVMLLSQLAALDLSHISPPLILPAIITEFSDWMSLTKLHFRLLSNQSESYNMESQLNLLQLQANLGYRSSLLLI